MVQVAPAEKTPYHSWKSGALCKGCSLCVEGKKLVLFITGVCGQRCFYCPISELKFGADVAYANEWKIADPDDPKELIEEARLTCACGAGITGGDPLCNVNRCCAYIRLLKKEFGREFHIHLYTPLKLVTAENLKMLFEAGLDEIRFHPDLDDSSLWEKIELAKKYPWDIGVEIPAVPGYEDKIAAMIDFVAGKVSFLNLNELELSDTSVAHYALVDRGYKTKDLQSYGAFGSAECALAMVEYAARKGLKAHYCTAKLKDCVQVKKRLERRAEQVALRFDEKTEDGTLVRGCAYLPEMKPGAGYHQKLKSADSVKLISGLKEKRKELLTLLKGSAESVVVDEKKLRLLLDPKLVKKQAKKIRQAGLEPARVEEYPTQDGFEVDVEFF